MRLRVTSLRPARRRAGFAFTREPVDLSQEDLGGTDLGDVAGLERLLAIVEDPVLVCVFVDDEGTEQKIDADMAAKLREVIADRQLAAGLAADNAEAAALVEQLLDEGDETELQPPSGATGNAEGDASASGAPGASGDASESEDASLTPPGTEPSSADGSAHSRQVADEPAADRKAGADEGNQPEETPVPPVAEQNHEPSAVPTGRKSAGKAKLTDATVK